MSSNCYKIDVIYYLNPHLIWVEIRDPSVSKDDCLFEQVGIYGILPLEKKLDIETDDLRSEKCDVWLPAATCIMRDLLQKGVEIWFSPTHIDRRTSIFDDNIHKFGELLVKTDNDKLRKLSKVLIKSGFAYYEVSDFHNKLSSGKLNTKLSQTKTQEVIKKLEIFYIRQDTPKNVWKKSVDRQTSVFQMSQNFESSLTISNIEKHNNPFINKTLESKFKDFELCKDVDEQSFGRACKKSMLGSDSSSSLLNKKLSAAKEKRLKTVDLSNTYDDIRKFLDANSYIENCSANLNNELRKENIENCETHVKDENQDILSSKLKRITELAKNTKKNFKSYSEELSIENNKDIMLDVKLDKKRLMCDDPKLTARDNRIIKHDKAFMSKACVKTDEKVGTIDGAKKLPSYRLAYGPPELNPMKFKIEYVTLQENEEKLHVANDIDLQHESIVDIDSEVGSDINILKDSCQKVNSADTKNSKEMEENEKIMKNSVEVKNCDDSANKKTSLSSSLLMKQKIIKDFAEVNDSDDSLNNKTSSSSSLLLKRKLQPHRKSSRNNSNFSSSDTSNNNSSSDMMPVQKSDDDNIGEVMERLKIQYKDEFNEKGVDVPNESSVTTEAKAKANVNPFKNIDPKVSFFIDKLVTPVLMVHSKLEKRIQPVFEMRDVYFNSHIHNTLKNMSIDRPMMLQTVSWFTILRGYSLFMISPLGSGKTLGYLPAVCRLVCDSRTLNVNSVGPICIIVCATAKSVASLERIAKIFIESEERVLACYAGVDKLHITATLLNGCDLLISTPSYLVRLLQATEFGIDLRRLSTIVLDDCERLSDVYRDEMELFLYKIREMLKERANKELKVQYVLASRIWCDFMESLAMKAPDTVICIGAFQECVLYSKANTSVSFVKSEIKVDSVLEFLKDINVSKKTVIVCQTDDEVGLLKRALKQSKHTVFSCDNKMTIHDLYNLSVSWADFHEPSIGPILICCDSNLIHMNITDAHNLIHFSLPSLFSMFCKRFSVLNDNYPSIFKSNHEEVKIKVLLEEGNAEQLPKILNFIRRCTDNVPSFLNELSSNVLIQKDIFKATKLHPLCDSLLTLGYCPDFYNCQERHTILKDYDTPKHWLPKEGLITCKIIYYHSATLYSARLLSCIIDGKTIDYPQTYSKMSLKMGMYYSKDSNRKLHGIPKVGDVCASSIKLNFYVRCQVLKILSTYQRGNPNEVLVKLIDEERCEVTRDIYLYHLPEDLKEIESGVVHLRLANIAPKDKDTTFSDLARDKIKNITDSDAKLFVRGNVTLTLGNCIFVNTLEACKQLTSMNAVVVKYNLNRELLEKHAISNPEHLPKLEKLCLEIGLCVKKEMKQSDPKLPIKNLTPIGTWAHLDEDGLSCVFFASALNPDKFFVRLATFESCMINLIQDIKKHVDTNPAYCTNVREGDIVLAKFPDDSTYERARVDGVTEDKAKCFFVDQGDWREIPLNHLQAMTEQFVNQLPFQAIECRLCGIRPAGDQWTDFSSNWFIDNCYDDNGDIKQLFVKYFIKEPAEFTNGHKYSIVLINTSTDQDVIINQLMIDLNLAQVNESEIKYLDDFDTHLKTNQPNQSPVNEDPGDAIAIFSNDSANDGKVNGVKDEIPNILFEPPIRSVPLVNSDDDNADSDGWDVHINDEVIEFLPALKMLKGLQENKSFKEEATLRKKCNKLEDKQNASEVELIELDSDDLSEPENTIESEILSTKVVLATKEQFKRPKLIWRQNKSNVIVKIHLIGADNYTLDIGETILNFNARVHDTDYAFELELYGVVDPEKCSHVYKGQYILVKLLKIISNNWLTLTRDGGIKKWIVYDVDSLDTSSEEENVDDSTIKNIIQNIQQDNDEMESDDDDFLGDA